MRVPAQPSTKPKKESSKTPYIVVIVILSLLLIASLAGNIVQYYNAEKREIELSAKEKDEMPAYIYENGYTYKSYAEFEKYLREDEYEVNTFYDLAGNCYRRVYNVTRGTWRLEAKKSEGMSFDEWMERNYEITS